MTADALPPAEDLPRLLTVVRGEPTPEQLAALVAVVAALRPTPGEPQALPAPAADGEPSLWGRPAVRTSPPAGPGAWRASGLPSSRARR